MLQHLLSYTIYTSFLVNLLLAFSSFAAPLPNTINQSPGQAFIGETFCFDANFSNTSSDIGYGPYYLLRLAPDLSYQSATFSGLNLSLVSNQTYDASGILNDPISGNTVIGEENGHLIALTIPVGFVSNNQPVLYTEICLDVSINAAEMG